MLGLGTSIYAGSLTVDTVQGTVHGKTINDGKVRAFLGLPYAAPPVGELRWKAPAPPSGWNGVRDAAQLPTVASNGKSGPIIFSSIPDRARIVFI